MKKLRTLLIVAIALQSGACFWVTTKHEGETLRRDVNRIDEVVSKQEDSLGGSVKKLKSTLDEASTLLARNSADLGAQFDELENENARLTGLVMEAKRYANQVYTDMQTFEKRIETLEARLAAVEGKAFEPPKVESATELYDQGMSAFRANDYNKARELFRKLVIKYPGHEKADDAQFNRGQAYFVQKDYKSALEEFQAVFDKFPQSALADDSIFRAAESAQKLKWCTDARAYYGLLRQKYPKSDMAGKAKKQGDYLKKNAKKKSICQS
jgi:tol-pal system protein YbgF|tara:strand:+ start:335 stop:1141 length:807 start_codon:yes stop_codon:yes gene_type:complete